MEAEYKMYRIGHLLANAVELSERLTKSGALQNAFRYSKIVDYSTKGFDCTQAQALMNIHRVQLVNDPSLQRDMDELLVIIDKIKAILGEME
jgi:hypothetical protein